MKVSRNISIDPLIWQRALDKLPNVSKEIEMFLKVRLGIKEGDIPDHIIGLDVEIDKREAELSVLKEKKRYIKEKEQKERDNMIEVKPGVFVPKSVYGGR